MSKGVNKCMLMGWVANDPKIGTTGAGCPYLNIRLGVPENYVPKEAPHTEPRVDWVNVTFYSKAADLAATMIRKGVRLYVCGRLRVQRIDKDDTYTIRTDIVVDEFIILTSKDEPENEPEPRNTISHNNRQPHTTGNHINDDDLPF